MRDTFKPLFPNRVYFMTPGIDHKVQTVVGKWRNGRAKFCGAPRIRSAAVPLPDGLHTKFD
jgi:hypothetical protein